MQKYSIYVVLDSQARIIDFETNIESLQLSDASPIGNNFFDQFVDEVDQKYAIKMFENILNNKIDESEKFSYDVRNKYQKHEYIDFKCQLIKIDNELFVHLYGNPHYQTVNF